MKGKLLSVCAGIVVFTTIFSTTVKSQTTSANHQDLSKVEPDERVGVLWAEAMENTRIKYGVSPKEFQVFENFESNALSLLRINLISEANKGNYELTKPPFIGEEAQNKLGLLLLEFQNTEKRYPSSVDEYRHRPDSTITNPCDSSGCTNMDFIQGTLNTWYGYYAINTSGSLSSLVGGLLGAVTQAGGNDANVVTYGCTGETLTSDYQIRITSGGYDAMVPTIPRVSPWATGGHSVMLGDSTLIGEGAAMLSKTFYVSTSTSALTYQYAVFLNNPTGHTPLEQPFFKVVVLDENGDTISACGHYTVVSGVGTTGWDSITLFPNCGSSAKVYYKPWTIVNVPLKAYIGHCVTINFIVADCSLGGHFGYAYVDCSCSPAGVITSSPAICGNDTLILTAPPGANSYFWTGPTGGIVGPDTTQSIKIVDSGTYTVISIPVTGATCADTISIHIPKYNALPPTPSFRADTVCAGQPTQFINTSDSTGGKFSWDFYNIGVYNIVDTNNFNPTWTYINPGKYVVKLNQVLNGCGAYFYDTVVVDTNVVNPTFTASPVCFGDTTFFTPTAPGASVLTWNFGDPSSGASNTSTLTHPGHFYLAPGTYTVTLNANNPANCGAIDTATVIIYPIPSPVITGLSSICASSTDVLTVSGGTSYVWNPGSHNGATYTVNPDTTTVYTVTATSNGCVGSSTFTVTTFNPPVASISPVRDTICSGESVVLTATVDTAGVYKWSTGSTTLSVTVTPTVTTTYTLHDSIAGTNCVNIQTATVVIRPPVVASISPNDSVCPGQSVTLNVTATGEAATYLWINNSLTSSSITVSPTVTTTYTAIVTGVPCGQDTLKTTINVDPLPSPVITGTPWKCRGFKDTLTVSGGVSYLWSSGSTSSSYITGIINADSTFSVTAKNSLGCAGTTTFTVTLRDVPDATLAEGTAACAGNPVEIWATPSTGTGPFSYLWSNGKTTDTTIVSPSTDSTFTVIISNGCKTTKTIRVSPEVPVMNACCDQTVIIESNTTTLWVNGTSSKYQWIDSNNVTCLDPPLCDSVRVTPTITTSYTVIGTDTMGCSLAEYLTIVVELPCFNFVVPNVFTPNFAGPDGHDNEFYIPTNNIDSWSIHIYDRWGKEVFTSNDEFKYWNGTNESGSQLADGVYYYVITGVCQNNTYKKEGFVQLIR